MNQSLKLFSQFGLDGIVLMSKSKVRLQFEF